MRTYFHLVFAFILTSLSAGKAQQLLPLDELGYLQKLQRKVDVKEPDRIRAANYLLLAGYWVTKDSTHAKEALRKAQSLEKSYAGFSPDFMYYQGLYEAAYGTKRAAIVCFEKSIELLKKKADPHSKTMLAANWYQIGYLQTASKGYDILVEMLTKHCIPLVKEGGDHEMLAYYYTQLGLTFMSVGQFDKAQEQHEDALAALAKVSTAGTVHFITYCNLVSNYCYKPDSKHAKIYLDKAEALIRAFPASLQYSNFYYQEGMYYTTIQDFPKALVALDKGVKIARTKNQAQLLQILKFRIYNIYLMQQNYPKAKSVLEDILQEKLLIRESVNRKIVYTQLAKVNEAMGKFPEAYQWLTKSAALSDSLQQVNLMEKMNELEVQHQSVEKQRKIDALELERAGAALAAKNKNLRISILAIAVLLLVIISVLIYFYYRNQKKLNRQFQINHEQQLTQIAHDRKLEAMEAVLQGEEQERQRLAQDLHDSMGGMLASIRMAISRDLDRSSAVQHPKEIITKLDLTIAEMRRISRNLMPETLRNLGLTMALRELTELMTSKELHVQFESYDVKDDIPFQTQLAFYRIAQESLGNVIKYAQANQVIVQISQDNQGLSLTIEDNGIGFEQDAVNYGLGIRNMKNRARLINGSLIVSSKRNAGTTVTVECNV